MEIKKDYLGNELNEGDIVVYSSKNNRILSKGKIEKINNKQITIIMLDYNENVIDNKIRQEPQLVSELMS